MSMSTRRARGEGSIKKLKSGRYQAIASFHTAEGKRVQPKRTFSKKGDAIAWLHRQTDQQNQGVHADAGRRTVASYLDEWLATKKLHIRIRSFDSHEQHVRLHLKPTIGGVKLGKLRAAHLNQMYTSLQDKGISKALCQKIGVTLSMSLQDAVRLGYIATNPAKLVRKPKADTPEIYPLDLEQARAFLKATEQDRLHALYVLALDTGMRQGELYGLHWPEVDFDTRIITIKQGLVERRGRLWLDDVKTTSSRRRIEVTPATLVALDTHRAVMLAEGNYQADGPVFVAAEGGFLRKSNVRLRSFNPALKRAGLPKIRFHDLRHTAATLMLCHGINIRAVASTLGHRKPSITLDIYSHKLPIMDTQRVQAMQNILAS